jgi:hypothetical protein
MQLVSFDEFRNVPDVHSKILTISNHWQTNYNSGSPTLQMNLSQTLWSYRRMSIWCSPKIQNCYSIKWAVSSWMSFTGKPRGSNLGERGAEVTATGSKYPWRIPHQNQRYHLFADKKQTAVSARPHR